jgi:hypothetical protein
MAAPRAPRLYLTDRKSDCLVLITSTRFVESILTGSQCRGRSAVIIGTITIIGMMVIAFRR